MICTVFCYTLTEIILYLKNFLHMQCTSISALESFLYQFDNESQAEPTYLSTLCCGCSSATIPVAEISHHWNIPHVGPNKENVENLLSPHIII